MAKKGLWVSISLFVALFAQHAGASTLDFEDLTFGASYGVGESFATSGVVITGEEFFFLPSGSTLDGSVSVGDAGLADGAGNELGLNNINLNFDFGVALYGLALQYGESGGNLNIEVNGEFKNFDDFVDIDKTTIGGASIFTLDSGPAGESSGALFIVTGTIESFSIGGQELWIDNLVASPVPEPTTLILLGTGGLVILARKKRFR